MSDQILDLAGRVALVTGAGQGVGRQIALHLAAHNSGGVVVNDYFAERAEAVAKEIRATGAKAFAAQADVTDQESVKKMVAAARAELGPIGVLVNNAGNAGANPTADMRLPFWETGPATWSKSLGVNLYGVINCTGAVVPDMIEHKIPGRVITIISEAGRFGDAGMEIYAAGKAGAAGFTRSLARTLGRYEITANCIAIAGTRTPATAARLEDPEVVKKTFARYVIRRPGEPEEIANMALFLASNASAWITGQTYAVNGGYTFSL